MRKFIGFIKYLLISPIFFLSITTYAYSEGFYVIPVVTEVIKTVDVCTGVSVGQKVFELKAAGGGYPSLSYGGVYETTTGKIIQVTGHTTNEYSSLWYEGGESFYLAPNSLPAPKTGVKGPFYYMVMNGVVVYAKYL
jgi:hypothetical protein